MTDEKVTWKPTNAALPDSDTTVLIFCGAASEPVWLGYYDGVRWLTAEGQPIDPSHWAALPGGPTS